MPSVNNNIKDTYLEVSARSNKLILDNLVIWWKICENKLLICFCNIGFRKWSLFGLFFWICVTCGIASGYDCFIRLEMEKATYPSETLTNTYQSVRCHTGNRKLKQIDFPAKCSRSTHLYTNCPPAKIASFYRICAFYVDKQFEKWRGIT
jgi:hypothetical protein